MKISCLPVSIFDKIIRGEISFSAWLALAKEIGFDGADISMNFITAHSATYLGNLKKVIEEARIPLVMCTTYPDFTHPDPLQREREFAYLSRDIALCSELQIPYLRVLAGQKHPGVTAEQGVETAVEYLLRAAGVADAFGVQLLYEDHAKPGAWNYIDLTFPPDLFLKVVAGIWNSSIRINFDVGNITAAGEDPLTILRQILPKVETIHVTDMARAGHFEPVLIGTGVVPLRAVFHELKAAGFDNWLCLEEASYQGVEGMKKALENTRRLWEEA